MSAQYEDGNPVYVYQHRSGYEAACEACDVALGWHGFEFNASKTTAKKLAQRDAYRHEHSETHRNR